MSAEKISVHEKMRPYFFRLEKGKARLEVFFDKEKIPGGSMLLATVLEKKKHELIIDELIPFSKNKDIAKTQRIIVRGKIDGCTLTFTSHFLRTFDYEGSTAHALAFPEVLTYNQLREYFRVPTRGVTNLVKLISQDDAEVTLAEGSLFDISKGGVSVEFENADLGVNPEDHVLLHMTFTDEDIVESAGEHHDRIQFQIPVQVKSERLMKLSRKKRVGFMFTDINMNSHDMVVLGKVVFAIQRRLLRNKAT